MDEEFDEKKIALEERMTGIKVKIPTFDDEECKTQRSTMDSQRNTASSAFLMVKQSTKEFIKKSMIAKVSPMKPGTYSQSEITLTEMKRPLVSKIDRSLKNYLNYGNEQFNPKTDQLNEVAVAKFNFEKVIKLNSQKKKKFPDYNLNLVGSLSRRDESWPLKKPYDTLEKTLPNTEGGNHHHAEKRYSALDTRKVMSRIMDMEEDMARDSALTAHIPGDPVIGSVNKDHIQVLCRDTDKFCDGS